jgi:hypothetical protein
MTSLPPRGPNFSTTPIASSSGSNDGNKSQKTSASDSPSASATNAQGWSVVDERLRSVLSHWLDLPLIYMLNGDNPGSLPYLARESKFHKENTEPSKDFDNIFSDAVEEWVKTHPTQRVGPQLTKLLSAKIEKKFSNTGFHSDAEVVVECTEDPEVRPEHSKTSRIGVLFTPEVRGETKPSTPFALIEVGCKETGPEHQIFRQAGGSPKRHTSQI